MPADQETAAVSDVKTPESYVSNSFSLVQPSLDGIKLNGLTLLWAVLGAGGLLLGVFILSILAMVAGSAIGFLIIIALSVASVYLTFVYVWPVFYRLTLAMARHQHVTLKNILVFDTRVGLRILGAQLLAGLAVLGGLIAFVVPGLVFIVWFSFTSYVILEENVGVMDALRRSRELVRYRFWDVAATILLPTAVSVVLLVPILGLIAYIVLSIILIPVIAVRYVQLVGLKSVNYGKSVPTSKWNYAIVVIAVIVTVISGATSKASTPNTPNHTNLQSQAIKN